MKEVRTYLGGDGASASQEKNPDAVCSLAPAEGLVSAAVAGCTVARIGEALCAKDKTCQAAVDRVHFCCNGGEGGPRVLQGIRS